MDGCSFRRFPPLRALALVTCLASTAFSHAASPPAGAPSGGLKAPVNITDLRWYQRMRSEGNDPAYAALDRCQRMLGNGVQAWQLIPGNVDECDKLRDTPSTQTAIQDATEACWRQAGQIATDLTHAHDNYLEMDRLRGKPESASYRQRGQTYNQQASRALPALQACVSRVQAAQAAEMRRIQALLQQRPGDEGGAPPNPDNGSPGYPVRPGGPTRPPGGPEVPGGPGQPRGPGGPAAGPMFPDGSRPGDPCRTPGQGVDRNWQPAGPMVEEFATGRCQRYRCGSPSQDWVICPGWPSPPRWADLGGDYFACGNSVGVRPPYCDRPRTPPPTTPRPIRPQPEVAPNETTTVLDLQESPTCLPMPDPATQANLRAESQDLLHVLAAGGSQVDEFQTALGKAVAAHLMRFTQPNPGLLAKALDKLPPLIGAAGQTTASYLVNDVNSNHRLLAFQMKQSLEAVDDALKAASRRPATTLAGMVESSLFARATGSLGGLCKATAERLARLRAEIDKARQARREAVRLIQVASGGDVGLIKADACKRIGSGGKGGQTCVPSTVAEVVTKETGIPWDTLHFNWLQKDEAWRVKDVRKLMRAMFGDRVFSGLDERRNRMQRLGLFTEMTRQEFEAEMLAHGPNARSILVYTRPMASDPRYLEGHMVWAEVKPGQFFDRVTINDAINPAGSGEKILLALPEKFHVYRINGNDLQR